MLQSGLQLKKISATNKLPWSSNRLEVKQKKAGKISMQEHEMILEEAERCNRLEYNDDDDSDEQEAGRGQ